MLRVILASMSALMFVGFAHAQQPAVLIPYSGTLKVAGAAPASASLTVSIYGSSGGNDRIWGPVQKPDVPVHSGRFSIVLGDDAATPLNASVLRAQERWLAIAVNGQVLPTRQRLVSVPYSLGAVDSPRLTALEDVARWFVDGTLTADAGAESVGLVRGPTNQSTSMLVPGLIFRPGTGSAPVVRLCGQLPNDAGDCLAAPVRAGLRFTPPAAAARVQACVTFTATWSGIPDPGSAIVYVEKVDLRTGVPLAQTARRNAIFNAGQGRPMTLCDSFDVDGAEMGVEVRFSATSDSAWGANTFTVWPRAADSGFHWQIKALL